MKLKLAVRAAGFRSLRFYYNILIYLLHLFSFYIYDTPSMNDKMIFRLPLPLQPPLTTTTTVSTPSIASMEDVPSTFFSWAGEVAFDREKATSLALQANLDGINREHGNAYIEGIQRVFDWLRCMEEFMGLEDCY